MKIVMRIELLLRLQLKMIDSKDSKKSRAGTARMPNTSLISFSVVLDDDSHGREVLKRLAQDQVLPPEKLIKIKNCNGIEDIFSRSDFSKYVLDDPSIVIPRNMKVSTFVKNKSYPKPILARNFFIKVEAGKVSKRNLDTETKEIIESLLEKIQSTLERK